MPITEEASDSGVAVGTNVIYAAIHQLGGVIKAKTAKGLIFTPVGENAPVIVKSVTMPARPYLGVSAGDEEGIIEICRDWLSRVSDGAIAEGA